MFRTLGVEGYGDRLETRCRPIFRTWGGEGSGERPQKSLRLMLGPGELRVQGRG